MFLLFSLFCFFLWLYYDYGFTCFGARLTIGFIESCPSLERMHPLPLMKLLAATSPTADVKEGCNKAPSCGGFDM